MKEKDMHTPVKNILENVIQCDEVYAEVMNTDFLCIKGPVNVIVEMKTQFSFKLLEQAYRGLQYAQYVYIAIPQLKSFSYFIYCQFLEPKGIGVIEVNGDKASILYKAKYHRIFKVWRDFIRDHIEDFSKNNIAGSKGGETVTRYSNMMDHVKRYMQFKDWVTVSEILDHCETYYAQPKPTMSATLMASYNNDWCETKYENGRRYYRYKK